MAAIRRRINDHQKAEAKEFVRQLIFKVDKILHDYSLEVSVYDFLGADNDSRVKKDAQRKLELFRVRYGEELTSWLKALPPGCKKSAKYLKDILINHTHTNKIGVAMADVLQNVGALRDCDPLSNWCDFNSDSTLRILERINEFASFCCGMLKWSFMLEPGRPRTELTEFLTEFEVIEHFFENADLNNVELSQTAFDLNYATKARNRRMVCGDLNRVILKPIEIENANNTAEWNAKKIQQPIDVFGDFDCPEIKPREDYGTNDFIHANYIRGGPLLNTFILTQSPMSSTASDFWRMVWQEKSEYIFMLCGAVDTENMTLLGTGKPSGLCPYYWPKNQGSTLSVGEFYIRNDNVCMTMDPLFTVTSLTVWRRNDPSNIHQVKHWQYDWAEYNDYQWPLRILLRSRTSKSPSIIHCMDGCGKSGTLVLIEIMLMQLLRGSNLLANPMITASIFLRLQRRNAISNALQYLFAYRAILHWCQPYVASRYNRFCLGYSISNSGFCGKFAELSAGYFRQNKTFKANITKR